MRASVLVCVLVCALVFFVVACVCFWLCFAVVVTMYQFQSSSVSLRGQVHYKVCVSPRAGASQVLPPSEQVLWLSEGGRITSFASLRGQMHYK